MKVPYFVFVAVVASAMPTKSTDATTTTSAKGVTTPSTVGNSTTTSTPSNSSSSIDSDAVKKLWKDAGISVSFVNDTTVSEPTELPKLPSAPPNMPTYNSGYGLPADFVWGVASSAYQVEGAVAADNRGPCIWDYMYSQTPNLTFDKTNADIAMNHYYMYKEDAQRLKQMGFPYYSMSVSWPRIMPFGNGTVNHAGLQHYIDEVDYLIEQGIEPLITLVHFDIPLTLQQAYGGFSGEQIIEDFTAYAKVVFDAFAGKTKHFITLNEPDMYCLMNSALFKTTDNKKVEPTDAIADRYKCGHNSILAHAKAVELFRNEVLPKYPDTKISYKDSNRLNTPYSSSIEDYTATNRSLEFGGWFAHPVYVDGDYPQLMKDTLGEILPKFTNEEKKLVKGSADWFAWDGYLGEMAKAPDDGVDNCLKDKTHTLWPTCFNTTDVTEDGWSIGTKGDMSGSFYTTPDWFKQNLIRINRDFPSKHGIMVAEFGFPAANESQVPLKEALYDEQRALYYQQYLTKMVEAVNEENVKMYGMIAWAIMDDFEWLGGYRSRFGIQAVDVTDKFKRYWKKSAYVFVDFFKQHVRANSHNENLASTSASFSVEELATATSAATSTATTTATTTATSPAITTATETAASESESEFEPEPESESESGSTTSLSVADASDTGQMTNAEVTGTLVLTSSVSSAADDAFSTTLTDAASAAATVTTSSV